MTAVFDPLLVPLLPTPTDLPPAPVHRLTAEGLRQQFRSPPRWSAEKLADRAMPVEAPNAAAVLIPLVMHQHPTVLLTRRTSHLKAHAGQISFPGGRVEPGDLDLVATALREAQEEVGIPPGAVEILGCLPDYTTVTGFVVTPVVGLLQPPLQLKLDAYEVDEVFEPSLQWLMTPAHHQLRGIEAAGQRHEFFAMAWRDQAQSASDARDYFIWGATAAMLRNLYRFLSAG